MAETENGSPSAVTLSLQEKDAAVKAQLDVLAKRFPRALRFDPNESGLDRFKQRMIQEPLVPIGALATVGVFSMMVRSSQRGDSRQTQLWMRGRVAVQGLTVIAVVVGMYRVQQDTIAYNAELDKIREDYEDVKKRLERADFEERLKQAELAYEQEKGLYSSWKGKKAQAQVETPTAPAASSWYHYLGWPRK
ncbi:hypothetical protein CYLTODRAFT_427288 [Cylindrobasidium torrendii FP15055 ss-10]|uniref:HIG1 domain-containing protein n=1 Tax=Cylindrobasidium torrendii FP15055 ss-10 TaxID=1314674 RepID=A0A0D7AX62_9AGAR|nr:hypothetical protein CYLTODRAFT_427288 [Cylindrobasidium torrendii FP15055 ss-10]